MTARKDLKRRIRERQQRTGESYVAARRAVLAERPDAPPAAPASAIDVVEMDERTAEAAELGLRCRVWIARPLSEQVEPRVALQRLRDVLGATTADPSMETLRAMALRGERPLRPRLAQDWFEKTRHFVARLRVGIGGVSEGGTMLGLSLEGKRGLVMMVCHVVVGMETRSGIVLTTVGAAAFYMAPLAVRALR